MTNTQVKRIKKGRKVRDHSGLVWTALHDAYVPERDTVNAQVSLLRVERGVKRVAILHCNRVDF